MNVRLISTYEKLKDTLLFCYLLFVSKLQMRRTPSKKHEYLNIILLLSMLIANSCVKENTHSKYALVYGISEYSLRGFELPYSANDAVSMSRLLERYDYEVICRIDNEVTMENILADMEHLKEVVTDKDLVLVFFSGHGLSQSTLNMLGDSTVNENYFSLLLDNDSTDVPLLNYVYQNALTSVMLSDFMGSLKSRTKLVILDACFSGTAIHNNQTIDFTPDDYEGGDIERSFLNNVDSAWKLYIDNITNSGGQDYLLLTSSGADEVSWDGFFSHSVFTYFFVMSAEQGDLDNNGYITLSESYKYVHSAIQKYWNTQELDAEWNFLPHISGSAADVIIFDKEIVIDDYIKNSLE